MNRQFLLVGMALSAALGASPALAQTTVCVSVDAAGAQGDDHSFDPSISAEGRFVAFSSRAANLIPGDTNAFLDVFVRDRQGGTIERISVATGGAEGNGECGSASISADGRFVAFGSFASNLVSGDTNGTSDVFVRDRQTGTTERVSVDSSGAEGNGFSGATHISADGRFVTFFSHATNLTPGDTNGFADCLVRDRSSGTTERVSVDSVGAQGNGHSLNPAISADGRFVTFRSGASNFVPGDTNGIFDIFVHDRQTGTIEQVNVATSGAPANDLSGSPAISADGRFASFSSQASNLVPGDTNGIVDIFVHDRLTLTTERVSVATGGAQGTGPGDTASRQSALSADGRFVAFLSWASNLVPGDTNTDHDIFVRDRLSGTTELVSWAWGGGPANDDSNSLCLSADGRTVAFGSEASNLVTGDTNGVSDVFVREFDPPPPFPFCSGDGTGTACPCGSGTPGHGCPSSVNGSGASLTVSGTASTTTDTLVLLGSGMPNSSALYFQGTTQVAGGAGAVFGDGLRCAGGTVTRLGTKTNSGGASQYPEAGDPSVSVKGLVTMPGVRTYQVWYRNAAAFCTPATFNLTNGLEATWTL